MTADEIEKRNIAAMGAPLGKQYTALFHEVAALHLYWKEFIELFGTNEKRIERLNRSAPGFFRMLQEQQFETNMLHMARLTDSPKSVGKENLTVRNLPDGLSSSKLPSAISACIFSLACTPNPKTNSNVAALLKTLVAYHAGKHLIAELKGNANAPESLGPAMP